MDEQEFWRLVERANVESGGECEAQVRLLTQWLAERPPEEILGFDEVFWTLMGRSYRWDLWAAAYIINGGCSDDCFDYFRGWLIAQGRDAFYGALADPETLMGVAPAAAIADWRLECEDMLGVAYYAYPARTGEELPQRPIELPPDPVGKRWDDETVDAVLPRLAAWADALRGEPGRERGD